ncbi:MAG: polysaccharide biosynthesis transport protein, partial [Bryobacterales bacterium]|nr:polysaccharide biosynthesis transport protein [Bryobacterales bacterium]
MTSPPEQGRKNYPALQAPADSAFVSLPSRNGAGPVLPPPAGIAYGPLAWRYKYIILGFIVLGAVAGTANVTLKTPLYEATTTVEMVGFNQSFMGMNQVDPQAGTDANSASASNVQTQLRILTSRTLLSRVVERMNLDLTPITSVPSTPFTSLRNRIPGLRQEPLVQSREALGLASRTVSARSVGLTRLIELQCQSTSPEVAANFVNTLAAEHVSQIINARSNLTQKTSQWMDSQLEEAKSRLQQSGEKLRDFVQKSGMDFFPEQATLADSKMRQLQSDVSGIQADRIAKQARWELAKNTPLENLPDVLSDAGLQALKGEIATLRREMAPLTATLTPEHYKVKRIQAQITETQQTFEKETASLRKRLQSDYEEALRREKLLGGAYNAQTHAVSGQADKASQYAMLKRDVDTQQQLYNVLLQQSSQAALIALAPSSSIRVVDAATPNPVPSSPKPAKDIPTWAVAGGALGYGLLVLREMSRRRKLTKLFDTPGHTQTILGVPELGVIPSTQVAVPRRKLPFSVSPRRDVVPEDDVLSEAESGGWQNNSSSFLSESFRQTLVSLLRNKPKDHKPVYVITSAGPGEGKTTISANLARAMAEVGHRVLLVDADLRRPALHNLLGSNEHEGLKDILAGSTEIRNLSLDRYIQETGVNNLSVMTHGIKKEDAPALLFFSPRLSE